MDLDRADYIDLYFGDESHFGLNPNVPYAWQHKDNPILLPSKKAQKLSVFGLMNLDCKLYSKMVIGGFKSIDLIFINNNSRFCKQIISSPQSVFNRITEALGSEETAGVREI